MTQRGHAFCAIYCFNWSRTNVTPRSVIRWSCASKPATPVSNLSCSTVNKTRFQHQPQPNSFEKRSSTLFKFSSNLATPMAMEVNVLMFHPWVVENCWNERGGGLFRVMAELVAFVSSDSRVCCLASTHAETNFCYHVLYEEDITCISIWMCCRCLQLHHGVFVKCLNVCEKVLICL